MSNFPDFKVAGFDMDRYNQQFREKNMIICARSKSVFYDKHWGCLSLKFVTRGKEFYEKDHCCYSVDTSRFLVLNRDTEYSSYIDSAEEVESFTLNFAEDFTRSVLSGSISKQEDLLEDEGKVDTLRVIERLYPRENHVYPIAKKIYDHMKEINERNDEIAELFVELLLALLKLNKIVSDEVGSVRKVRASTQMELYRRLYNAKDFIDTCFNEDLNLDRISSIACLNREYFIRQFKIHFKITPIQYLIKKRMEEARLRLLNSDEPISSICHDLGYSDATSFGKLFRRLYKTNPENFRINRRSTV
jgi:AraC family transcriptional regulator